jgi:hypothetical protein
LAIAGYRETGRAPAKNVGSEAVFPKRPASGHPPCPKCGVGMIVADGFKLDREDQTFKCLRCGHVDYPDVKIVPEQAAAE